MITKILSHLKRVGYILLINKVLAGTRPCFFKTKRRLLNGIGYQIGDGTKIVGPIHCNGSLSIGKNCWIGTNLTVHGNGKVIIEDSCDLGPEVCFLTGTHQIGSADRRAGDGYNTTIKVSSGCWIGGKSTLVNGIIVGKSSVIAAGALVCKSVEDNTLVGGVPAKVIRAL